MIQGEEDRDRATFDLIALHDDPREKLLLLH